MWAESYRTNAFSLKDYWENLAEAALKVLTLVLFLALTCNTAHANLDQVNQQLEDTMDGWAADRQDQQLQDRLDQLDARLDELDARESQTEDE